MHHTFYLWGSVITTLLTIIAPFLADEFNMRPILVPHYDFAEREDRQIKAKIVYFSAAAGITNLLFHVYAFTIWNRIYTARGYTSTNPKVIYHEYEHVRQWHDLGLWAPIQYLHDLWKFGYVKHPMERAARLQAGQRIR